MDRCVTDTSHTMRIEFVIFFYLGYNNILQKKMILGSYNYFEVKDQSLLIKDHIKERQKNNVLYRLNKVNFFWNTLTLKGL